VILYLELAQKYLVKARSVSGNTQKYFANLCQVCLAKQNAHPSDIGTTEQELANLQNVSSARKAMKRKKTTKTVPVKDQSEKHIQKCKKYLSQCRAAHGASRQYYANLCSSSLAQFGLTHEDIETSAQELQDLQRQGLLESAINYLKEARVSSGTKRKCYADLCSEFLLKAQAKPEEIGSSQQELAQISS
jgi:hypothetical protein